MMKLEEFLATNLRGREHVESLVRGGFERVGAAQAARAIRSLGIVGAGMMGTAVASAAADAGLNVVVTDVDDGAVAAAKTAVIAELLAPRASLVGTAATGSPLHRTRGRTDREAREIVGRRLRCTADVANATACDLVLESVAENPRIKQAVYAEIEPLLAGHSILGTNTSTIPIRELAATLDHAERFCGVHFFHPVRERPLIEVIHGPQTDTATITAVRGFAAAIGKLPIVVEDGPGFLVNRLLLPYVSEAMELLLDGGDIRTVQRVAVEFGMAKGPLRLLDEIGLDTALQGGWVLSAAFPRRTVSSPLLVAMIKAGNLGVKTGAGFFVHAAGAEPNGRQGPLPIAPGVAELIAKWKHEPPQTGASKPLDDAVVLARLMLPMILEATRLLEDRAVSAAEEIDLGVLFGLGFPVDRGGLLYWADTLGSRRIVESLATLEALGPRARPTDMLLEMAAAGRSFYGD